MFKRESEDIAAALVAELKGKFTEATHVHESELVGILFSRDSSVVKWVPRCLKPILGKDGLVYYRRFEVDRYIRKLKHEKGDFEA